MASDSQVTPSQPAAAQQSLGDLVALAVSDLTQLVRCEVDLAKLELKQDARRLGVGGMLVGVAAFFGCLILMVLSFAYAYLLVGAGVPTAGAFGLVALTYAVLAVLAVLIGRVMFRRLTGLRRTRGTVSADIALIRRESSAAPADQAKVK